MHRLASTVSMLCLAASTLAAGACGAPTRVVRFGGEATETATVQGPHVPSGTAVHVRLSQPLDLSSSTAGATFDAVLDEDLHTPTGDVLVRSGATIHGRVATSSRTGNILLRDATVSSPVGPLEIRARLVDATQPESASPGIGPQSQAMAFRSTTADGPRGAMPLARESAGAPSDTLRGRIPADSAVTLQLTRPILAPNANVLTTTN